MIQPQFIYDAKNKNSKRLYKILNTVAIIIGLMGLFYPTPYDLVVVLLILLPIFAISMGIYYRKHVLFEAKNSFEYPSMVIVILFPSTIVGIRGFLDWHVEESSNLFMLVSSSAVVMLLAIILITKDSRTLLRMLTIFISCVLYSYGTLVYINCRFDNGIPIIYDAMVIDSHIKYGKRKSYYITINSWKGINEEKEISISKKLYENCRPQSLVSVAFSQGQLKIPWYCIKPLRFKLEVQR